jgi:hypothetical protein
MNKIFAVLGLCAAVVLAVPVSSQQAASPVVRGIYGRWDPGTGIFTPVRPEVTGNSDDGTPAEPPLTTYTGKFVVNFTITITSAIPTTTTIACNASATVVDASGQLADSLSTSATRSGSTASCSVTIPYSWSISSASDLVYVTYDISAPPQPLVSTSAFPRRYSSHPITTITVPATGSTTTYTIAATI